MQFSETELKIVTAVVDRFINDNESTKRRDLVVKFRSPESIDRLIARGLYFIQEFSVLHSYGPAPGPVRSPLFNLEWMLLSERIVTLDAKRAWDDHIRACAGTLQSIEQVNKKPQIYSESSGDSDDRKFSRMAVDEARKSISEQDGRPRPKVGAVVVKDGNVLCTAHRGEVLGNHAEFIALERKLGNVALVGSTVYTTLEPCTTRNHPKVPCAVRLAQRKVRRVVIGMLDPDTRISGKGQRSLRRANIITDFFPHDLMAEVEEMNREFTDFCEQPQIVQNSNPGEYHTNKVDGTTPTTTDGQREEGRRWVEKVLKNLIENHGLRLDPPIRWTPDFDREIYAMEVSVSGVTKVWRVSYEALEDCLADKNVQRTIERSLAAYFATST